MSDKYFSGQYQDDRPLVPVPPKLVKVPADPVKALPEWHDVYELPWPESPWVDNASEATARALPDDWLDLPEGEMRAIANSQFRGNLLSGLRAKRWDAQSMD